MTYKNRGWKDMKRTLDQEMPDSDSINTNGNRNIITYLLALLILLLAFSNIRTYKSVDLLKSENKRMQVEAYRFDLENSIGQSLLTTSGDLVMKGASSLSSLAASQSSIGLAVQKNKHLSTQSISVNKEILFSNEEVIKEAVDRSYDLTAIPSIIHENIQNPIVESTQHPDFKWRENDLFTPLVQENPNDRHWVNSIYTLGSMDKSFRFNGTGVGIETSIPLQDKISLSFGLGYLWTKNYDAIQATREAEIRTSNTDGTGSSEFIKFNTKILVDHLHYIQLPITIGYRVLPKWNLGLGLENRFLVNNYHTDGIDTDYNSRFNAYIVNAKTPEPYKYDLRKIAMGINGSLEYQLFDQLSISGHFYSGLLNISGDRVFNNTNNIKNSSYQLGLKYNIN